VERPLAAHGYDVDRILRHILDGLTAVLRKAGIAPSRLLGIGVGVPGVVDRSSPGGAVVHGQTIGWDGVPLEALLRDSAELPPDLPIFIDNGAKTLGQAEMWFGAGRGARHAIIALIGSGVGACIVADGVPYGGAHSSAGEWGHTTLQVRGRQCRCGARGCLEAYIGAEALLERWSEITGEPPEAEEEAGLASLLASPDPRAAGLLAETAEYLGAGIADLVNLFNPERIIICGWAGLLLGRHMMPEVQRAASAYALRHPVERTTIELGRLGPDAVTVGAATLPLADFLIRGGRDLAQSADAGR
jgi:predicted NBD/HSP70 family sugar kinase